LQLGDETKPYSYQDVGAFQSPSGNSRVATTKLKEEQMKIISFSPLAGIRGLQPLEQLLEVGETATPKVSVP